MPCGTGRQLLALNQHDVILLFSNGLFDESLALGDAIRDYVEIGGNVVTASFYWQNRQDSGLGSTGWGSLEQVDAMTSTGGANYSAGTLGTVVPHPLTTGLSTLTASTFWGGAAVRTGDGAVVAATWADSSPLVAYRVLSGGQRMVGVSLFPAVADAASGDVDALFRNAVTWAAVYGPFSKRAERWARTWTASRPRPVAPSAAASSHARSITSMPWRNTASTISFLDAKWW